MNIILYYVICALLSIGVLAGISMMGKVKTAVMGNTLGAVCMALAILVTLYQNGIVFDGLLWISIAIGFVIGTYGAYKIKMIEMPQGVALLNGVGGLASVIVAIVTINEDKADTAFSLITALIALSVGMITFTGSMVAAGKLHKLFSQRSVVWKNHQLITSATLCAIVLCLVIALFQPPVLWMWIMLALSAFFGIAFAIRVGGADMPITISLLNSLTGVACTAAGMAIADLLLVSIGGIVGVSGLLLTQIMCRAMNRKLPDIMLGKTSTPVLSAAKKVTKAPEAEVKATIQEEPESSGVDAVLAAAKKVIIVPGYGMALAQAQSLVKQLGDKFVAKGTEVKYAIHPVAGRMPGHMNVLLCEVDIPYEELYEMDVINPEFDDCDLAIVIGANDVVNPAANTAEGTPIYGMPILNVEKAKHIIVCNYDTKPGYAGVDNPIYSKETGVTLMLGDAQQTLKELIAAVESGGSKSAGKAALKAPADDALGTVLTGARKVIIVPGYGMALAQAQSLVKQLGDKLVAKGTEVKYAIHPVAGRMPGHMNVLLCEVDIPYEELYEMDVINPEFDDCDLAIIIGANDVVNPAANTAEGTPIYGMPILNVEKAKHIIVCNYDTKPGYAGVDNPIYSKVAGVTLMLGDAQQTLKAIIDAVESGGSAGAGSSFQNASEDDVLSAVLAGAKKTIIVPGYGMALAQAQSLVKQLGDKLAAKGTDVKYAIHPVAGRMPGHMNVLLCEVDIPYEELYEMDIINPQFDDCDLAIIIGANDVVNPAANTAEGTPIYGMPILNVEKAKHIIVCNYDTKPGYAGVDNPIYTKGSGVTLLLGDAQQTLKSLIDRV